MQSFLSSFIGGGSGSGGPPINGETLGISDNLALPSSNNPLDWLNIQPQQCEFGQCIGNGFAPGTAIAGTIVCEIAEPCGAFEDALLVTIAITEAAYLAHGYFSQHARGNVADSGIQSEAQQLVQSGRFPDICSALDWLLDQAKRSGDTARVRKIQTTQKENNCRRHR
jgi:hypothetical protein